MLALLFSGVLSLGIGTAPIPPHEVIHALLGKETPGATDAIVRHIRLPRLTLAILVGAALAVAGVAMQGFFQNPMADPYIVGVSSGAALGATIAMVFHIDFWFAGLSAIPILAFAGALGTTFLVYALSLRGGRVPVGLLLLIGVSVGALAAAATSFLMIVGDEDTRLILFWILGSLSSRRWDHVVMVLPYVVLGILAIRLYARDLNVLLLGEETARHTGVDVEQVKRIVLTAAALLAAAAVSACGIVGFVGLIVPHLIRLLTGPDHRRLIPLSALAGSLLMVLADLLARLLIAPSEMPIGIVTAVLGCPFFLFLISRRRDISF
ncbi:MAG: iron chelate uptake ABC transporter family permease subunit [bacterium]|nr:iron chelate uptake ABC transporter family permease subunit [bacterium]